jgi:metal-sulfur cluster biosynthetic enzyme
MSTVPQWALDALSDVYDPCCREKGISVVDMGLVRSVQASGGHVRVELLLTEVQERMRAQPGVTDAEVEIVWDEAWTTDRLSPGAARLLRFLPPPAQIPDRAAYLAAHLPARGDPS